MEITLDGVTMEVDMDRYGNLEAIKVGNQDISALLDMATINRIEDEVEAHIQYEAARAAEDEAYWQSMRREMAYH